MSVEFRGPPDPLRGDEYYRRVRDAAKECLDAIYDSNVVNSTGISGRIRGVGNPEDLSVQSSGGWSNKLPWGGKDQPQPTQGGFGGPSPGYGAPSSGYGGPGGYEGPAYPGAQGGPGGYNGPPYPGSEPQGYGGPSPYGAPASYGGPPLGVGGMSGIGNPLFEDKKGIFFAILA